MHGSKIPIWFFIGVLLVSYGVLITGYGLYEVATGQLADVQLKELHAPLWWGATLLVLGLFYTVKFRPGKTI
jgi:hypothetical protein